MNVNLLQTGQVEIDGVTYNTRQSTYGVEVAVTALGNINFQITGNGQGPFIVTGLSNACISGAGADVTATTRFKTSLQISDGSTPITFAGNTGSDDQVVDTLLFGKSAAFPNLMLGPIYLGATSQMRFKGVDLSNTAYRLFVTAYVSLIL